MLLRVLRAFPILAAPLVATLPVAATTLVNGKGISGTQADLGTAATIAKPEGFSIAREHHLAGFEPAKDAIAPWPSAGQSK